jgi:hypothetical protein
MTDSHSWVLKERPEGIRLLKTPKRNGKIILKWFLTRHGLDGSGSRYDRLRALVNAENKRSGSINCGEFLDYQRSC